MKKQAGEPASQVERKETGKEGEEETGRHSLKDTDLESFWLTHRNEMFLTARLRNNDRVTDRVR